MNPPTTSAVSSGVAVTENTAGGAGGTTVMAAVSNFVVSSTALAVMTALPATPAVTKPRVSTDATDSLSEL